jgi:hypothetical protein
LVRFRLISCSSSEAVTSRGRICGIIVGGPFAPEAKYAAAASCKSEGKYRQLHVRGYADVRPSQFCPAGLASNTTRIFLVFIHVVLIWICLTTGFCNFEKDWEGLHTALPFVWIFFGGGIC